VPVADANGGPHGKCDVVEEAHLRQLGARVKKIVARAEAHRRRRGVDVHHERRRAEGDAEPFALADGEAMDAGMRADDAPLGVEDGARPRSTLGPLFDEGVVPARGDEAELLAFPFGGAGQPAPQGVAPHLGFGRLTERKLEPLELLFGKRVEEVALVLVAIFGAMELDPVAVPHRPRVVARRHLRSAEPIGQREELGHFDGAVARDAGAGRAAREVGVDERIDDFTREELAPVERVVGNAEVVGDAAGVVLVLRSAAAPAHRSVVGVVPEMQGDADDVVAPVDEPRRGDGGIHPPAHGHDDALSDGHRRIVASPRFIGFGASFSRPGSRGRRAW
jgi:hypothetical protein